MTPKLKSQTLQSGDRASLMFVALFFMTIVNRSELIFWISKIDLIKTQI